MTEPSTGGDRRYKAILDRAQHFVARNRVAFNVAQVVFVVAVVVASFLILLNEEIRMALDGFGAIGAFVANLLSSATVILPAPGLLFSCVSSGVNVSSIFTIGIASAVGSTLGETTAYVIGYTGRGASESGGSSYFRRAGRRIFPFGSRRRAVLGGSRRAILAVPPIGYVARRCVRAYAAVNVFFQSETHKKRLEYLIGRYGGPVLFLLSVLPLPFFDVAGILAGGFRYPLQKFYLWVLPGKIIKFILIVYACQSGIGWIRNLLGS